MDVTGLETFDLAFRKPTPQAPTTVVLQAKAAKDTDLDALWAQIKAQIASDPVVGGAPLAAKGADVRINQGADTISATLTFAPKPAATSAKS